MKTYTFTSMGIEERDGKSVVIYPDAEKDPQGKGVKYKELLAKKESGEIRIEVGELRLEQLERIGANKMPLNIISLE